jgi:hypothetical protein
MKFEIIENKNLPKIKKINETMNLSIPGIDKTMNIPYLNGNRYIICGVPGSGKSNLLINLFKNKKFYKGKFDNLFVFMPSSSIESVKNHPFKDIENIYDELTPEHIYNIINILKLKKSEALEYIEKKKNKFNKNINQNKYKFYEESESDEEEEPKYIEYSCIVLDDIADKLKDKQIVKALKKLLIQSRHIMCVVIITLQNYFLLDKSLRKLINYISIFEPPNLSEWNSYNEELIGLKIDDSRNLKQFVFNEKYNHLDINITNKKYYVNYNELKILDDEK